MESGASAALMTHRVIWPYFTMRDEECQNRMTHCVISAGGFRFALIWTLGTEVLNTDIYVTLIIFIPFLLIEYNQCQEVTFVKPQRPAFP